MLSTAAVVEVATAFEREQVRYLFVGGLAVIAHGYLRLTTDLDVVIDLEAENTLRAVAALARMGFRPRIPVAIDEFADPRRRHHWASTKGMVVFSVWRDGPTGPIEIDLFIIEPFPFDHAYADAFWQLHDSGVRFPFVDFGRLLAMKAGTGRPKDLLDIAELRKIHGA